MKRILTSLAMNCIVLFAALTLLGCSFCIRPGAAPTTPDSCIQAHHTYRVFLYQKCESDRLAGRPCINKLDMPTCTDQKRLEEQKRENQAYREALLAEYQKNTALHGRLYQQQMAQVIHSLDKLAKIYKELAKRFQCPNPVVALGGQSQCQGDKTQQQQQQQQQPGQKKDSPGRQSSSVKPPGKRIVHRQPGPPVPPCTPQTQTVRQPPNGLPVKAGH